MQRDGYVRLAVGSPRTEVAAPTSNRAALATLMLSAAAGGADILCLPELAMTGYTCADLFQQQPLLDAAVHELFELALETDGLEMLTAVGLPLAWGGRLYNTAAVLHRGQILGIVPKCNLPNYKEYYERRWFTPPHGDEPAELLLRDQRIPFGADLLFEASNWPELCVGIEICEDLWVPQPPSSSQAVAGATVLLNCSASNEGTGKAAYRRQLVAGQSARCIAAYAYSSSGVTESTTDLVFGGHLLITENGHLLAENDRFSREGELRFADVDLELLMADRLRMGTFANASFGRRPSRDDYRRIPFEPRSQPISAARVPQRILRKVEPHPFVPKNPATLGERCEEIFSIQTAALAKRIEVAKPPAMVIGVSGGLDSTLALLVAVKVCDRLGLPRRSISALTMPGFGTSDRTKTNAIKAMDLLGVSAETVDIRPACLEMFRLTSHRPFGIDVNGLSLDEFQDALGEVAADKLSDLVFENVQARMRTILLMNRGFVIGTGDLSELALGWCTYNADHMSMYNPNVSVPKTLVKCLVRWVAEHEFAGELREVLLSIAETEISPELLPIRDGKIQSTESTIGPYELHDFFLFQVIRYGFGPRKILRMAAEASFDGTYIAEDFKRFLRTFYSRFFVSQYKRSCLPDGPKVGSISLSPRGDWRMPSDAQREAWLHELDSIP